jgi:hypothetical protein
MPSPGDVARGPLRRHSLFSLPRAWLALPLVAALVFVAAAVGAAFLETPTFDEYAHVPAGVADWRRGQFDLHPYNPPLGKLWMALPVALDPRVEA